MGLGVCITLVLATFVAIAIARIPLAWVLLGIGGLGCVWAYVCLGKLAESSRQKASP
jgi:chromate transporter